MLLGRARPVSVRLMWLMLTGRPSHAAVGAVVVVYRAAVMVMAPMMRIQIIALLTIAAYNIHAMLLIVAVVVVI